MTSHTEALLGLIAFVGLVTFLLSVVASSQKQRAVIGGLAPLVYTSFSFTFALPSGNLAVFFAGIAVIGFIPFVVTLVFGSED